MSSIFQVFGGLAVFLFGMKIMSEGLQKIAGKRMRQFLGLVSNNRFVGCGIGTVVTSVIQSSSATTVMLVGFVNAGLMTLTQAIGVVLGANVGTTVTAQLIAFNIESYALPAIAAGFLMRYFTGRRRWSYIGDALMGFGFVFYGLTLMKAGFAPLSGDPDFISFFTGFTADHPGNIILCVLAGTVLTMVLQSSSAVVGITMALASQGLLDFRTGVALILGDNIGTTITAELASVGANLNAHRTARAHTLFNVTGVALMVILFPYFTDLVVWLTSGLMEIGPPDLLREGQRPNIARYLANSHTLFNVINALFFLLMLPLLVKAAIWLTPINKEEAGLDELYHIKYIDFKYIDTPSVALAQARAEILRMGQTVQLMYQDVVGSLKQRQTKKLALWRKREDALDNLQKEITQFLVRVMQGSIMDEESREVVSLMRMVNNLERIGDGVEHIAHLIEDLIEEKLYFSEEGLRDYDAISQKVKEFLDLVVEAIRSEDKGVMQRALEMEVLIDSMREEMKTNHLGRLQCGICSVDPGLILVDMLAVFEKMGDFCYNIAQGVAGIK
ncbi:MAG: Na/Pi cotransporter family protein [Desulfobacterales bacterium]|nr:Na/Pi cotransporter family protein [Desulfobacterales bacterium]